MLRERDRAQEELKGKLRRLRDDFQYNLTLIEERDAELDRWVGGWVGWLVGWLGDWLVVCEAAFYRYLRSGSRGWVKTIGVSSWAPFLLLLLLLTDPTTDPTNERRNE
jgi:hypothetical protein